MGIDKSLDDRYPSIIINGSRYHFGRHPGAEYDHYLVENTHIAKDSWWFEKKEDFVAFLVNLPESADRNRMRKMHPDWHEVTPEQRSAYIEDGRAELRAAMEEKIRAGTAQTFPVYPDDGNGPYNGKEPFKVEHTQPPLERVEAALRDQKRYRGWNGLTEAGKLSVLERLDWSGFGDKDKEAVLAREVDFKGIPKKAFDFVYMDLVFDGVAVVDSSVAKKLFEEASSPPKAVELGERGDSIRPVTRSLIAAIALDLQPTPAAAMDFGIRSQEHLEAIYYAYRNEEISVSQLDAAYGNGPKLTELANAAPSNPHKGIVFETPWDHILPKDRTSDNASAPSRMDNDKGRDGR